MGTGKKGSEPGTAFVLAIVALSVLVGVGLARYAGSLPLLVRDPVLGRF